MFIAPNVTPVRHMMTSHTQLDSSIRPKILICYRPIPMMTS